MKNPDIIFKNEGEYISVIFNSKKSKQSKLYEEVHELEFFNKESESFLIMSSGKNNMIALLATYKLKIETI